MEVATKYIFTQIQAMDGFKFFSEKAIAAMFKDLKELEHGPMPGKCVLWAIDPDKISYEDKKKR